MSENTNEQPAKTITISDKDLHLIGLIKNLRGQGFADYEIRKKLGMSNDKLNRLKGIMKYEEQRYLHDRFKDDILVKVLNAIEGINDTIKQCNKISKSKKTPPQIKLMAEQMKLAAHSSMINIHVEGPAILDKTNYQGAKRIFSPSLIYNDPRLEDNTTNDNNQGFRSQSESNEISRNLIPELDRESAIYPSSPHSTADKQAESDSQAKY